MIRIKDGFVIRKVAGEYVGVPVGEHGTDFRGMLRLNETGAFLWELCEKGMTKGQILQEIIKTYEIDETDAERDLESFLEKLQNAGILEEDRL